MRQSLPAQPPLGSTVHGRPVFVFKCLQLEIITQPKVIFVLFVSKIISEIIIALVAAAKQAADLLLLVPPVAAVAVRATAVAIAAIAAIAAVAAFVAVADVAVVVAVAAVVAAAALLLQLLLRRVSSAINYEAKLAQRTTCRSELSITVYFMIILVYCTILKCVYLCRHTCN